MPEKLHGPEADTRLAGIVDTMQLQIWQITDERTYGYLNKAHAAFIGVERSDAAGKSIYQFFSKEAADHCIESNKTVFEKKTELVIDEWFLNAQNEKRLLHVTKTPKLDQNGNVLFVTCAAEDITEQHYLIEMNLKKERILNAIANFSRELFSEKSDAISQGLSILGSAVDVDRVYYWKNRFDAESDQWLTSQLFEWCSESIVPQISNEELQNLPLEEVSDFVEPLKKNRPFKADIDDLPDGPTKDTLAAQQIQSILVLPMFLDNVFAGFVGFDSCRCRRDWSKDEIFLLRLFVDLLTKALNNKQLQDEIEQSRRNFNNFFEMIDDMLFILDGNARIRHANRALIRKTGYEIGELVGNSILMLHSPDRYEEARSLIFSVLSGTCHSYQIPFQTKSGIEVPVSVHIYNGRWNGEQAHFGVAQDVSLLQFSEQKFFKAFDDSYLLKAIVNANDGSIIDANKSLCSAMGYEITEVLGKTPIELHMLTSRKDVETVRKAFREKRSIEDAEVTIYNKDLTTRTVLMNASPIEVGQLSCFIVSMLDITERKEMEDEIRKYNEHLESLVQEKVHEISDALWGTITALVHLTEFRDGITGAHIKRLAEISRVVSARLASKGFYKEILTDDFISDIQKAITLHDIGKVGIRDDILLKKGKLSPEEFEEMKAHTRIGAQTLREAYQYYPGNGIIKTAIDIAASHHERWDGKGYPAGLKGEDIPLSAQITAICDVYDALRSERSYKAAMSREESLAELKTERGTHFNPVISDVFLECEAEIAGFYE